MRICIYLCGIFALFIALPALTPALPVDAQGCAGGKCGITTTLSPSTGPTGSQVNLSIQSGAYPLDGNYEVWFSKSPTMADDPTAVRVAQGFNQRLQQSVSIDISVPEASSGTNYFHFIKAGRAEQMINFSFTVTPSLFLNDQQVGAGSSENVTGSGFSSDDDVTMYIDGVASSVTASTDDLGSFSVNLPIPTLGAGTHVIKATAKKLYNQDASVRFKIAASIKIEPAMPKVGDTATITGDGFAAASDVSIKYDDKVVANSPNSDNAGHFIYNFTVPDTSAARHIVTATDASGNVATWELPVESTPPSTPTPISPTSDRFGVMGSQPVTFTWTPATDESGGQVTYNLEVADNLNFFPLMPGMRRTNIADTQVTLNLDPGTYYWHIQAVDPSGNKGKWALSPYAFQVGLINMWLVVGASLVLLVIFILLLRAFIQRIRGYYY
ncbi:MAG: hypothetical protein WB588_02025 [Dehalococcoidia bacterium]|jgi:hypothetical protein